MPWSKNVPPPGLYAGRSRSAAATYLRLWSALVVSGCCVSAHETAATWAMNSLRAPALWLSMMSSAGTFPFFLFTLPAGALADLADRRRVLRICNCWLACSAGLIAVVSFLGALNPEIILASVFLLGTGFAFQAPVASASIPEIVGQKQLPSAIALGGIQMNLAGILGPAIGGFLVPLIGVSSVFAINALGFVLVLFAVMSWKRKSEAFDTPLESFFDSLAGAVRYMRYAPGVQIVLLRNFTFGVLIGAIPALLPVVGLKALHFTPLELGFAFTCMGLGSLTGALFVWGTLSTTLGLDRALFSASALGLVGAPTARRWSIDFSTELNLEPDPLAFEVAHGFGVVNPGQCVTPRC
jgi:MFS family permease